MAAKTFPLPDERVQDRFWSKVTIDEEKTECWIWTGTKSQDGSGVFAIDGQLLYCHRVSYRITRGVIPEAKEIRRSCQNKLCVRPTHLVLVERGKAPDEDLGSWLTQRYPI